ncbi:LuxR C-terminal-related transcriptional regulator [Streptomyces goshikiensis]|uniref:helix-turn-helix transcriptional regulator n=1 Tax=Streptomyces goshikiensis TaxID=1942 RepID=UPI00368136E2
MSRLTGAEVYVYGQIAEGLAIADDAQPTIERLREAGLILQDPFQPSGWVAVPFGEVETRLREIVQQQLELTTQQLAEIPLLVEQLRACHPMRARGGDGIAQWVDGKEAVNAAIALAVDSARHELLTAQPGPRPKRVISLSTDRDKDAVERGVVVRTLYSASSRSNPAAVERVNLLTAAGAAFRTLPRAFMRLIMVDREIAIIEDHADGRPSFEGAYLVRDRAVCGFFAAAFEIEWRLGLDWHSEEPTTQQRSTVTTPLQRTILRELCAGKDQQQIAKILGYSAKTVNTALSDLRTRLGVATVYQVVAWWAGPEGAAEQAIDQL